MIKNKFKNLINNCRKCFLCKKEENRLFLKDPQGYDRVFDILNSEMRIFDDSLYNDCVIRINLETNIVSCMRKNEVKLIPNFEYRITAVCLVCDFLSHSNFIKLNSILKLKSESIAEFICGLDFKSTYYQIHYLNEELKIRSSKINLNFPISSLENLDIDYLVNRANNLSILQ